MAKIISFEKGIEREKEKRNKQTDSILFKLELLGRDLLYWENNRLLARNEERVEDAEYCRQRAEAAKEEINELMKTEKINDEQRMHLEDKLERIKKLEEN